MKRKLGIIFILFFLVFIPGCWDIKDINDTAFALSIGIDKAENPKAKYLVTLEFAKPVTINQSSSAQSLFAHIEADSILEALQRIQTGISRSISLSHLRVVVVGEEIARTENFQNLANYLMKEQDTALQLRLLFVEDARAKDAYTTDRRFEPRFAAEIVMMGLLQKELPIVRTNSFLDFIIDLKRSGGTAFGSRVFIDEDSNVLIREGAAVFKDWKLYEWLDGNEALNANWITEDTEAVVVAFQQENIYTYRIRKSKARIKPVLVEGKPAFTFELSTEGMIMEEFGENPDLSKPQNLKQVETLFAETIRQQVISAIAKAQHDIKADYLGFGNAFEQYYPKVYQTLQWNEIFPTVAVDVNINCKVSGYGLMK